MVCRVGERRKEEVQPKEKKVWQSKKSDSNGNPLGTTEDKVMEKTMELLGENLTVTEEETHVNVVQVGNIEGTSIDIHEGMAVNCAGDSTDIEKSRQGPNTLLLESSKYIHQGFVKIMENQEDDSDEECEEVSYDKVNEVGSETLHLREGESSVVPNSLVDDIENALDESGMQGEVKRGYCSDLEKGDLPGSRGKDKAYDSEGADRLDARLLTIRLDKSQRVHT